MRRSWELDTQMDVASCDSGCSFGTQQKFVLCDVTVNYKPPSSSVSHVLISGDLNVISSKKIIIIIFLQWRTQEFCSGGGSTNSVEDRGQRERGSGAVAH
jgi:hypothetical protein